MRNKTRTKADKKGELSADKAESRRRQIRITSDIMGRHSLRNVYCRCKHKQSKQWKGQGADRDDL
jgi:hypothetical protein